MATQDIRVRFAPSPTGPLHIGGVRTALYNYLFARHHGGKMILRIEDTDRSRFVPKAEEYIKSALQWCGITFDEGVDGRGDKGPYKQSERAHLYRAYADELLAKGKAYYAFDSAEDLDRLRQTAEQQKQSFIYGIESRQTLNNSLNMSEEETEAKIASGAPYVIRFMMPAKTEIAFRDMIRGEVKVHSHTLDDKVLYKSDGMPTYHLANIVDDHLMAISHVIRGEEWLPSAPLHVMLYEAFGWDAPLFAHLPVILKPVGKGKLSKRDGQKMGFPVFPMNWTDPNSGDVYAGYKESGYFPQAFINMLALLGWNPGTEQELFDMPGLIHAFDMARVGKAGAKFDPDKAKWFNQQYMKLQLNADLAIDLDKQLKEKGIEAPMDMITDAVALVKERCIFAADLYEHTHFFFRTPTEYNAKVAKKRWKTDTPQQMKDLQAVLQTAPTWEASALQAAAKHYIQSYELSMGAVMNALRLAIVGDSKGPDLFEIIALIGRQESCLRIDKAIETLS